MAKILVVGGAGYVGSAVVCALQDRGHEVWVLDNLSTGHRSFIFDRTRFIESNAGDVHILEPLCARERFEAVFHFAAKSIVSESVEKPELYFENNVEQTRRLLDTLVKAGVRDFIFSSTCAVYANPGDRPVNEDFPLGPLSPYGESKKRVEEMLAAFADKGLRSIALRYFNASGCEPQYRVGENHFPETHLIPTLLRAGLTGETVKIFGDDYDTKDGTCVRDYVHVNDLANAHIRAMEYLVSRSKDSGFYRAYNLGSGVGHSVKEIVAAASEILGKKIQTEKKPRRAGDAPLLVAETQRIEIELGFYPMEDLRSILTSAFEWERRKVVQKKAIFLDRDGTLNFDPMYLNDAEQLTLLPGVVTAMKVFRDAGYLMYVVTNQSGIGRGKITPDQLHRVHERMDELFQKEGVRIEEYACCIHHPNDGCACRKPKPQLVIDLAARYGLDLSSSYMIGDKATDVDVGIGARCGGSVFLMSGNDSIEHRPMIEGKTKLIFKDLFEFARATFPNHA